MKTVLSNAKKYLSVLLAMAMVVLSVPNAPVTLLAATVEETTEAVESTETTEAATGEEVTEVEPEAEEAPAAIEEPVADDAAVGAEEEAQADEAAVGAATLGLYAVVTRNLEQKNNVNLTALCLPTNNIIYMAVGGQGVVVAAATDNGIARDAKDPMDYAVEYGSTGSFTAADPEVVSIMADPSDGRSAVITGLKAGTTTVTGTFRDAAGNTYTTDKGYPATVVVYGLAGTPVNTKYAAFEGQNAEMLSLKINDTDEDGIQQDPIAGAVTYNYTSGNGNETISATWNAQTQNGETTGIAQILNPVGPETGANQLFTARGEGQAQVLAEIEPTDADAGDRITLTGDVSVVNIQNNIIATEVGEEDPVENTITDNAAACVNPTGNEWKTAEEIEKDESVVYNLKALYDDEDDNTSNVTFVRTNAGRNPKADISITGSTLTIKGTYTGTYDENIFAKNADDLVVGILTLHWNVTNTGTFGYVDYKTGTANLASDKKWAIVPKAEVLGSGTGITNNNKVVLATSTEIDLTTNWNPTVNEKVQSSAWNTAPYDTDGYSRAMLYQASGNTKSDVYGDQTVTVKPSGKDRSDSYLIRVVDASVDGEKPMSVSGGTYQVTLNVAYVTDNYKTTTTYNAYDATGNAVATANVDSVIYGSADGTVTNNTAKADSVTLSVLGGGSGAVTIDPTTIVTTGTLGGYYKAGTRDISGITYPVAGVIKVSGATITAAAPGEATFAATYTDGDKKWVIPVHVVVEEVRSGLRNASVTTNIGNEENVTIAAGQSAVFKSTVSSDMSADVSGLDYSYAITKMSQNGRELNPGSDEDKAKIDKITAKAVITGSKLQTTKDAEAFDVDTELLVTTTATLKAANGEVLQTIGTTTNKVTVLAANKSDIAFTNTSTRYLKVGDEELVGITGNSGKSTLAASTTPEGVIKTSFVTPNYDGVTINALTPGTSKLSVAVDGIAGATPITLDTVVYGIATNNKLALTENGQYELTVAKFGDVYDNNIQLTLTNGSVVTDDNVWSVTGTGIRVSQSGVLTIQSAPSPGATVKVKHTDRPDSTTTKDTEITINVVVKDSWYELKAETANKSMDATTTDLSQFTLNPGGIYSYYDADKKAYVTENGFVDGVTLTANVGDTGVVKVARNDDNTFAITPVGVGSTQVTVNALNGATNVTTTNGSAVYTVFVKAPSTFKKGADATPTTTPSLTANTMNAFTNFAVTAVSDTNYATAWSSDPTLAEAIMYNEEGTAFNTGWEWDVPTKKISTLANKDGASSVATANYVVAGQTVTTNVINITNYYVDGLTLTGSGSTWDSKYTLVEVEPGVYSARLGTKKNNLGVKVDPVIYQVNNLVAGATANGLWEAYPTMAVTSDKTSVVGPVVNKDKKSFNLNTTSTSGKATITAVANGLFAVDINATTAAEGEMATMAWTNSGGTASGNVTPNLDTATLLQNNGFVINLDSTVKRDNFYVAVPISDVTGNVIKSEKNAKGDIYVTSSDPSIVELGGELMNQVNTATGLFNGNDGYVYTMDLTAKKAGKAVVMVTATDEAETTLQFTVNVVDGKQPVFEEVTLSNARDNNYATMNASYDDKWFTSGGTDGNADGLVAATANVLGDAKGYFKVDGNTRLTWSGTPKSTTVEPGDYTVTLKGTSELYYHNSANAYVHNLTSEFTAIPLTIHVTDLNMITPTIADATIKQGVAGQDLDITIDSAYSAKNVKIKDAYAEAAKAAGITISGTTISAAKNATPGWITLGVMVEADNVDSSKKGAVGDAELAILVEESDAAVPSINNGAFSMVRGDTATLTASWSDEESRTNTFALTSPVAGFTLDGDKLTAGKDAKEGDNVLNFSVSGTDKDGKVTNGTAKVTVTITKFNPEVTLASSVVSVKLGKTASIPISNPKGYTVSNYEFDATSLATLGGAATLSTDGVLTATSDETKVGDYPGLAVFVDVSNGTDTIEDVLLSPLTVSVKKSGGGEKHEDEHPEDASDEMTVSYIAPDMTYDGTAKTLQNLEVFWNGGLLTLNTDYTVKYSNNKNVGTGACTITGKGLYAQTMTIPLVIEPRDISESSDYAGEFTAENVTVKTSDKVSTAKIKMYWNGKAMKNPADYAYTIGGYDSTTHRAAVNIVGQNNFTGERVAYVYVTDSAKDAKGLTVKFTKAAKDMVIGQNDTMYPAFTIKGGGSATFGPTADSSGQVPKEGYFEVAEGVTVDYHFEGGDRAGKSYLIVDVEQPTAIGTATYIGSKTQVYTVKSDMKFSKDNVKVTTPASELYYDGLAKTIEVSIADGDKALEEGTDFVISAYKNNIKAGKATATITGLGAYAGNKYNAQFEIAKPTISIDKDSMATSGAITKTGAVVGVPIIVKNGDTVVDTIATYKTTFKDNKKVGQTATVTIKGTGNFQGEDSATFTVTKGEFDKSTYVEAKIQDVKYTATALSDITSGKKKPVVVEAWTGKTLTLGKDYEVTAYTPSNEWDDDTGFIDVNITIKGKGDYEGETTVTEAFHIYAGDTATKINTKSWTQKKVYEYPNVWLDTDDINDNISGSYSIQGFKAGKPNAKSATYSYTVHGEGIYGGTATFKYQVLPSSFAAKDE